MTPVPYILQGKNIVLVFENKPYTITESNINYTKLKAAIISEDWGSVPDLITPEKAIATFIKGHFEFVDGLIFEEGIQVHNALTKRILSMYEDGFPIQPMLNFYKNIKLNPSNSSIDELYMFLEANSLPITEDGHFIAYKKVRENYFDCHSNTFDNSIGKIVSMDRKGVNNNRDMICSTGLHFCSFEYLNSFDGDRIMVVKVNPMDVVSIPTDYNNSKGRCCKYEVIGEVTDIAQNRDVLVELSVYSYDSNLDGLDNDEYDEFVQDHRKSQTIDLVDFLSLRQHALIWNELTGENLKKFSYRADVDRRIYNSGKFTTQQIIDAAKKLNLI